MGLWCGILNYGKLPAPIWKPIGGKPPAAGTAVLGIILVASDSGQFVLPVSWSFLLFIRSIYGGARMVHPESSVLLSTFRITKQAVACKNAPGAFAQPVVAPVKKGYFLEKTSVSSVGRHIFLLDA